MNSDTKEYNPYYITPTYKILESVTYKGES